jgi:hypothetical protein
MMITNFSFSIVLVTQLVLQLLGAIPYDVTLTSYSPESVDPRWGGVARWTGEDPVPYRTAACPEEWAFDVVMVEGYGVFICEDTPANGWYEYQDEQGNTYLAAHIDIFVHDYTTARIIGVQRAFKIWRIDL